MRKTTEHSQGERLAVNTKELMAMLGCGRPAATEFGIAAHAKIKVGKRVLWNVSKLQQYLDEISE